jgi:EAL domain-containing protein (putative c-di-GMP-specific phosphodiesterase class I)
MTVLKAMGITFALDDFGTGYSSMTLLRQLPLSQLKIDYTFVRDVLDDPNNAAIVSMIICLGRTLDLQVVAEGVETAEQLDFMSGAGCHLSQGYYFSKALPGDRFEEFIDRWVASKTSNRPPAAQRLSVV